MTTTERRGPREPLLLAATGFTIGLFLGPPQHPSIMMGVELSLAAALVALFVRRSFLSPVLLTALSVVAGILTDELQLPKEAAIIARAEADPGPIPVQATIAEAPEATPFGLAVIADLVADDGLRGRARLILTSSVSCAVHYGETLDLSVRLRPPDQTRLPAFRARALAVRRGAGVTGSARCPKASESEAKPPPRAALLAAGDRAHRPVIDDDLLSQAGMSYLYALGGLSQLVLSLSFVALVYSMVGRRSGRRRVSLIAGLVFALALAGALGHTPSALRIFGLSAILLLFWARTGELVSRRALAVVVLVVCGLDPASIGDVRFQLAFAAVTAAIGPFANLAAATRALRPRPLRGLVRALALGAAIAVGTAPLVSRQFEHVSVASLVLGSVQIPLVAGVLAPLGVVTRVFSAFRPPEEVVVAIIDAVASIAAFGSRPLPTPTLLECCLAYLALLGLGAPKDRRAGRVFGALMALGLVVSLALGSLSRPSSIEVLVLPVAEGTSILARGLDGSVNIIGIGSDPNDPEAPVRMIGEQLRRLRATRATYLRLGQPGESKDAEWALNRQVLVTSGAPVLSVRHAGRSVDLSALGHAVIVNGVEVKTDAVVKNAHDEGLITLRFTPERVEVLSFREEAGR
ncbi:MAG: ComEC/Rec2 family competence protein [Myxococcota bacterium]